MLPITLPFTPKHILIGSPLHVGIADLIRARRPDLSIRGAIPGSITDADLSEAEVFVGFGRPRGARNLGNVRWVHSTGAGVDVWLREPALDPGILLTRSSESFGPMISEWVVARVFAIQQQMPSLMAAQSQCSWAPRDIEPVAGTRALLLGTGDIGTAIASSLHALGCEVIGVSRSGQSPHAAFHSVHRADALPDLVGAARWIISSLPNTPLTRGLVSRDLLSRCHGAALLNAGRGAVVDEDALPEALDRGWLRAVALDVFVKEPLPATSLLWKDPRAIISPHISGLTTVSGAANGFLECLDSLAQGEWPKWTVDRIRGY